MSKRDQDWNQGQRELFMQSLTCLSLHLVFIAQVFLFSFLSIIPSYLNSFCLTFPFFSFLCSSFCPFPPFFFTSFLTLSLVGPLPSYFLSLPLSPLSLSLSLSLSLLCLTLFILPSSHSSFLTICPTSFLSPSLSHSCSTSLHPLSFLQHSHFLSFHHFSFHSSFILLSYHSVFTLFFVLYS